MGRGSAASALFLVLAILGTWPLAAHLGSGYALRESPPSSYDFLLNTWILCWGPHALSSQPTRFFDGNILYPRVNTLAYSDHMIGWLPFTALMRAFGANPVLVHNTALLLTFWWSGLTMFLLVRYLTGSTFAGVTAGIIYAFCPFRFGHIERVQALSIHWVPMTVLFLCKLLRVRRSGRTGEPASRVLILAFVFALLTVLSCCYCALMLPLFLGIFCAGLAPSVWRNRRAVLGICAFLVAVPLASYPFFRPYVSLRAETGFRRDLGENIAGGADVVHYLTAPRVNSVYGDILHKYAGDDRELFTGFAPLLLALVGLLGLRKRTRVQWVFLVSATIMFVLSLGPVIRVAGRAVAPGPYRILYELVPGFDGLRRPARMAGLFAFCIAALAGYGAVALGRIASVRIRNVTRLVAIGALCIEFCCVPLPVEDIPVEDEIPPVYKWLARLPGNTPIIELPVDLDVNDLLYMYFSTYHWKPLVNGVSGWSPPEDGAKAVTFVTFDVPPASQRLVFPPSNVELLQKLGVRYMVLHSRLIRGGVDVPDLSVVQRFGDDLVYAIPAQSKRHPDRAALTPLPPSDSWRVSASPNGSLAGRAADDRADTCWTTGRRQRSGDWLLLDLGRLVDVAGVRLYLGRQTHEFPRRYHVESSVDGDTWRSLARDRNWNTLYMSSLSSPRNPYLEVRFPPAQVRWLRVTQEEPKADIVHQPWSVTEIAPLTRSEVEVP